MSLHHENRACKCTYITSQIYYQCAVMSDCPYACFPPENQLWTALQYGLDQSHAETLPGYSSATWSDMNNDVVVSQATACASMELMDSSTSLGGFFSFL